MAKIERYQAQREFKLDCGHTIAVGQTFVVTKMFTCESDAQQPVHALLTQIKRILENGVTHLKNLEWNLRHAEQA